MVFKMARNLSNTVHWLSCRKMEIKFIAYSVAFVIFFLFLKFSFWGAFGCTYLLYLITGGWKYTYIIIRTVPRDMRGLFYLVTTQWKIRSFQRNKQNIVTIFKETVRKFANKVAFILVDGKEWTFTEVDQYSNRIANFLYDSGYQKGDVIAMLLESKPEYPCMWLGIAKVGATAALINYNLKLEPLAHSIRSSKAKAVVFNPEFADALEEVRHTLPAGTKYYCYGDFSANKVQGAVHLDPLLQKASTGDPPRAPGTIITDPFLFIYTSGTTGLPKPAIVSHLRFFYMAFGMHYFFRVSAEDVVYTTMPLYHTNGGVLGIGQAVLFGSTVVIKKKFSASRFWDEAIKYNATATQYIGEIARYLLAQPAKPTDTQHRIRLAYGNGLRPQIWEQFMKRFNIAVIGEFYGSTEGNTHMINSENKVGAVGFNTRLAPFLYPISLIRVDEKTGEPIRGRNGMCMRCEPGEAGEIVGKIKPGDPLREFDGYTTSDATKKKIIENVFSKGDKYFLSGDQLVMDDFGYYYFKDRSGDTFRWKGENVATMEVEAVISNITKLTDAVVYGVEIPGTEGRAGMAAIAVPEGSHFDVSQFNKDVQKALPNYARPMFLRFLPELEATGTFKLKKTDYKKEGINVDVIKDKMYYFDQNAGDYKLLTKQAYEDIRVGKIKF